MGERAFRAFLRARFRLAITKSVGPNSYRPGLLNRIGSSGDCSIFAFRNFAYLLSVK